MDSKEKPKAFRLERVDAHLNQNNPSDCIPHLWEMLRKAGFTVGYYRITIEARRWINPPANYLFSIKLGENRKQFMLKCEREVWRNAGYWSREIGMPVQFSGPGLAPNLDIYQDYIRPMRMPLVYWTMEFASDQFYIIYYDDLEEYDDNAMDNPDDKTETPEGILVVPIKALKRLDLSELKEYVSR